MSKNNWLLVIVLVALTTVYAVWFTDWFRPKTIQIFHACRKVRVFANQRTKNAPVTLPVMFGLGARYQLTELKVWPLDAWRSNHNALPVWHLISATNSAPVKEFMYGRNIPGMKPAIPGTHAEPLEPNVSYHLFLQAGSYKGEHNFEAKPVD